MTRASGQNVGGRSPRRRVGLSRDQYALIHVARRDLHLEEDEYRRLLSEAAGVTSSRQLDAAGFTKVLERLKVMGFVHRPGPSATLPRQPARSYGHRPGMATAAQIELITRLWSTWSGSFDERAMNHWMERSYGVTNIRFATVYVAQQAIDGLRAMVRRKGAPTDAGRGSQ